MRQTSLTVLLLICLWLAGCAETLTLVPQDVSVAGQQQHYVFATGRDINGGSFNVLDRYDAHGRLVARDGAMNSGILPALFHGAVAGAEMGAGIGAGLAAQGAANVVQNGGGASSTGGAVSNKNTNFQAQGQFQGQQQQQRAYGGTGIGIGGAGGSATIQKGAITNTNDVF